MKKKIFIIATFLFLAGFSLAFACEPCGEILTLEETIEKAEYVVVGQKVSEAPDPGGIGGPAWVEIEVDSVLKGEISENTIKLAAWYGMCAYGFANLGVDINYVLFLQKEEKSDVYEAVDWGCAVRRLVYKDEYVVGEGEKMTLDDFSEKYGIKKPVASDIGGITLQEDCLIGAEDSYERWACQNGFLKTFARRGILSEVTIVIIAGLIVLLVSIILLVKLLKRE